MKIQLHGLKKNLKSQYDSKMIELYPSFNSSVINTH